MSERYYADRKRKRYDDFEYSEKSYHRREDSRDRRRGYKYRRGVSPSRSTVASSSIDDEVGHFNVSKGFLIRDRCKFA